MADVVMVLSNGFSSDPRVEKEARALLDAGRDVTLLAWDRTGELPRLEEREGLRIERLGPRAGYGRGVRNLGAFREFWRTAATRAQALDPRVLHCHDLDTYPVGSRVARATGAKLVVDFHESYRDSSMVPQTGALGALARRVVGSIERRAVRRADAVIVVNAGVAEHYGRWGAHARLVVVENAPDADVFRPDGTSRALEDPFVIGFFGQKRYAKGLRTLIDAVQHDAGLEAVLAGGGTAADDVARMVASSERVTDSGSFTYAELPGFYAGCDAIYAVYDTALGNWRTAFPVKVMEAMACGLPSIVAEGTWVGEYVRTHEVGIAVTPGDEAALLSALRALKDDPGTVDAMGRNGRRIVEAGLNWRSATERLLSVYEGL